MHVRAPWVVRELSPDNRTARSGDVAKYMATGARRIRLPLPADVGAVDPANASPVVWKRWRASFTVLPMSKHFPVLLR